jgi:ABC-type glycerol-3-phosphate transport system substrate-binding protein
MSEPKKVDRRKFIYAGLGAVALIAIGAAAYVAMNPPVVTVTTSTTVPTTSVVTTTQPTTVVTTVTQPTTTVITTTAPTEITLRTFYTWVETRPIYKPFKEQIDKYNQITPGVKVNAQFLDWTNMVPIVTAMIKAGVPPDSVSGVGDREIAKFADAGYFLPLDELIPKELKNEIPQSFWDAASYGGKIYGVPTAYSSVGGIYYNKEMFEKAGIEPSTIENPWSWDEFIEICKKLAKPDEGIYAYGARAAALGYFIPRHFTWFFFIEGVDTLVQVNGVWKSGASLPGFRRALEKIYDLVYTYKVMPKGIVDWKSADDQRAAFCGGKVAMVHCEGWFAGQLKTFNPDFKWGFCYTPQLGKTVQKNSMMMEVGSNVIFKESKYPRETMQWILYMSDYENVAARYVPEGYIPPFTKWKDDSRCDDFQRKHVLAFPYCRGIFPPHPKAYDINVKVFEPGIQDLILGKITPEALAEKMDAEITKILEGK